MRTADSYSPTAVKLIESDREIEEKGSMSCARIFERSIAAGMFLFVVPEAQVFHPSMQFDRQSV